MFWRAKGLRRSDSRMVWLTLFLAIGWLSFSHSAQAHCDPNDRRAVAGSQVTPGLAVSLDVASHDAGDPSCELSALLPDNVSATSIFVVNHFSRRLTLAVGVSTRPEPPPPRPPVS